MSMQHLSDEAVAACADGVLTGHARNRAQRHVAECAECAEAVRVQREAAWALRTATAPALPNGLVDRLRTVPLTTSVPLPPTGLGPDGTPVLLTGAGRTDRDPGPVFGGGLAPMAAFVPPAPSTSRRRGPVLATTAAMLALAGAVTAGVVAHNGGSSPTGPDQPGVDHPAAHQLAHHAGADGVGAAVVFRSTGH